MFILLIIYNFLYYIALIFLSSSDDVNISALSDISCRPKTKVIIYPRILSQFPPVVSPINDRGIVFYIYKKNECNNRYLNEATKNSAYFKSKSKNVYYSNFCNK